MRRFEFDRADGSIVEVCLTGREDGDFHLDAEIGPLTARRESVMAGPWAVVRQVHGARVVDADPSGGHEEADGLVTATPYLPIAVQAADCAPMAFVTTEGPIAVAHAGWRGLVAGIVGATADRVRAAGGVIDHVLVGSTIGPECYEFGEDDLATLVDRFGEQVSGRTDGDRLALDMVEAVTRACGEAGVPRVELVGTCTACGDGGFSHRARAETERHALVARVRSAG